MYGFNASVCVQEQPLGGPRIKHVCRAAAVALGQPRALVPDDIPRLSALPLHEREGITFSPAAEGTVHPLMVFFVYKIILHILALDGKIWECDILYILGLPRCVVITSQSTVVDKTM